ncbi:MAG: CoA transferase [Ilumatobacteraceae bacterium]|nr:CoA transferase [Ilumatobacteraceae bacterium]
MPDSSSPLNSTSALAGLRVLDLSTVLAGPNCARYLADFGADVIKIERPDGGDSLRNMGWRDPVDGEGLWWRLVNRNKRTIALNLKDDTDRELFLRLIDDADVLVENFRPGVLEKLGFAPDILHARNAKLIITRVSGFGQDGPYANRPGFASIAEAMSGLASITGVPGGDPMLPPFALTDEVTGLVAAFATMVALWSEQGQVVDVSLLESLFQILGPLMTVWLTRGELQPRMGSLLPYTVPRGVYRCSDGQFVGISTSSDSIAARVVHLLGFDGDDRFTTFAGRIANREIIEAAMEAWFAQRTQAEALAIFQDIEAAAGPILSMEDIEKDPHYIAREAVITVEGTPMQSLIARLSATPGAVKWRGRATDADGDAIRRNGWNQ